MKDVSVYTCKDGRTRAYIKETKKVVSYPRLLMEEKLGRKLNPDEQIHHIDENPLNNDINNLEIMKIGEHQRKHAPLKYFDKLTTCVWCGKEMIWTAKQQRDHHGNCPSIDKPFCSKSCIGKYGKYIQNLNAGMAK